MLSFKQITIFQCSLNALFGSVIDFDINESGHLYCISNDRILKSTNEGENFGELNNEYSLGFIDFPNEIISIQDSRLIAKGISHFIRQTEPLPCIDCYISYPELFFITPDDGNNWTPEFSFPQVPNTYADFPDNRAISSDNFVKTSSHIYFVRNGDYSNYDLEMDQFIRNTLFRDNGQSIHYGLEINGDLIQNLNGQVGYSRDAGNSYMPISNTNSGLIYPGINDQSLFVISDEVNNSGSLTYLANYDSSFENLRVELRVTGETLIDSFERIYTHQDKSFLFVGDKTYEVVSMVTSNDNTNSIVERMDVFPNPSSSTINIVIDNRSDIQGKLKVLDAQGRVIDNMDIINRHLNFNIELYPKGMYYFQAQIGNQSYAGKFTKI